MDWSQWKTYGPYKKLWSLVIGRPWTYFSRDVYHQVEYVVLMISLFSGFFTGYYWAQHGVPLIWLTALWGVSTLWFIIGHILWGTKYEREQKGK